MLLKLLQKEYILINWATHQVLSGCKDNADTGMYVCSKTKVPEASAAAIH